MRAILLCVKFLALHLAVLLAGFVFGAVIGLGVYGIWRVLTL